MTYRSLFIWVEGEDDLRFFNRIVEPLLKKKYDLVVIRSYANIKRQKVGNFIRSIKRMNASYIYVTDINNAPCITAKKQEILDKVKHTDKDRIAVVIREIESWYLAGLGNSKCKELGIPTINSTEKIHKERFNNLVPKKFYSRIDFMLEILKNFSIEVGKRKNKSFKYFIQRYNYETSRSISNVR